MKLRACGLCSVCCALTLLFARFATGAGVNQNVSFAWSPDPTGQIAGYVIYCGPTSSNYTTRLDVGTNTQVTLTGFLPQSTNYFALTAYNSAHVESAPSAQIIYTIPVMLQIIPPSANQSFVSLEFPVMQGHSYELQASTDLVNWSDIWVTPQASSDGMAELPDIESSEYNCRYYRLVLH